MSWPRPSSVIIVEAPWPEWPARPIQVLGAPEHIGVRLAIRVSRVEDRGWTIHLELVVGERDTGQPIHAIFDYVIPHADRNLPRPELVRNALAAVMLHEVDESTTTHGRRTFDPHVAPGLMREMLGDEG